MVGDAGSLLLASKSKRLNHFTGCDSNRNYRDYFFLAVLVLRQRRDTDSRPCASTQSKTYLCSACGAGPDRPSLAPTRGASLATVDGVRRRRCLRTGSRRPARLRPCPSPVRTPSGGCGEAEQPVDPAS
jgi:hypothetical protein